MKKRTFINGADYFQLYLDKENKKLGAAQNVMRLLLIFEKPVDLEKIKDHLAASSILDQINSLQLRSKVLKNHFYWSEGDRISTKIEKKQWDGRWTSLQPFENLPENHWLKIDLLENGQQSGILFHLHHLLSDNKGFQQLIHQLNDAPQQLIEDSEEMKKCGTAARFFKETGAVLRPKNGKMCSFAEKKKGSFQGNFYIKNLDISQVPVLNASSKGAVFPGRSAVLLNAVASAMEKWDRKCQHKNPFYWVPVPVDRRKIGKRPFSLGNHLSLLFYRINKGMTDEQRLKSLQQQMLEQIKSSSADRYEQLTNTMTKFTYPLYKAMLELPDSGKFCTFTYSDLGATFKNMDQFMGNPLSDVLHFPSIPMAPGIVFATMGFKEKFHLLLGVDQQIMKKDEAESVLNDIEKQLKDA